MITYRRALFKPREICCMAPLFSQSSSCPCHSRQMNVSDRAKCTSAKTVGRLSQTIGWIVLNKPKWEPCLELRHAVCTIIVSSAWATCRQWGQGYFNSEKGGKLATEIDCIHLFLQVLALWLSEIQENIMYIWFLLSSFTLLLYLYQQTHLVPPELRPT